MISHDIHNTYDTYNIYKTRNGSANLLTPASMQEKRVLLWELRRNIIAHYRPLLQEGPGPIRVMARIVDELEQTCREHNVPEEIIKAEIVNRTIGDINLRLVTECEGVEGGAGDYRLLADEIGVALPGEELNGYTATGETCLWLRNQMMECERLLLSQHIDLRNYDIYGVGNRVLRNWLVTQMQPWKLPITGEQVYLSLGAMDGVDKTLRALRKILRERGINDATVLFPEPGFGVPEWQARSHGYHLQHFRTLPEHNFKLTAAQLDQLLQTNSSIHILYLTVTSNPTAFAYTAEELKALYAVLKCYHDNGRPIFVIGDLAYIGTGKPKEDVARMRIFSDEEVMRYTILVSSFSKTHTLTGERFGWVTIGDPALTASFAAYWTNTIASLPAEWQLRFMAYVRLIQERPWLVEKLRAFYRLRRQRLIEQLRQLNTEQHLFARINLDDDATVYNWSQLQPAEDAFSFFEKTGIASVPGSGFGYSDDYIRFSIGVIPVPRLT